MSDIPIMENKIQDAKDYLTNCTDEEYQTFVLEFVKNKDNDGVYIEQIIRHMQELGRG